jgi:phosphoribosylformylglycinamidine synthase
MRARVLVRPKEGILDPQGQAVERALPALGFTGVSNVHVGRLIELDVADPAQLPEMCERLLANPLIEEYEIVEDGSNVPEEGSIGPEAEGSILPEATAQ